MRADERGILRLAGFIALLVLAETLALALF